MRRESKPCRKRPARNGQAKWTSKEKVFRKWKKTGSGHNKKGETGRKGVRRRKTKSGDLSGKRDLKDTEGGRRQRVGQRNKARVKAAAVLPLHIGETSCIDAPVREGEDKAAALVIGLVQRQGPVMLPRHALTDCQSKSRAVWGKDVSAGLPALKEARPFFRRNPRTGIGHGEQDLSMGPGQLQKDGPAGGSKLEGIREKLPEDLLNALLGERADIMLHGTDQPRGQIPVMGVTLKLVKDLSHQGGDILIQQQGRFVQRLKRGQVIRQPKDLIIALVQGCGAGVEFRVLLAFLGGGEAAGGEIEAAHRPAELCGEACEQGREKIRFHKAPFRRLRGKMRHNRDRMNGKGVRKPRKSLPFMVTS